MISVLKLLRPWQWYKNIVIFLALIFSQNLLNFELFGLTLVGFVALCLVSSANYVLNDIIDVKRDRQNPEKRKRPVASRKISIQGALALFLILLFGGLWLAYVLEPLFALVAGSLFLISTVYSLWLKHVIFADIIIIASLFVLRAVAGGVLIRVWISPWLVMGVLFLAMYLVAGKRYGELVYLKAPAKHRPVLKYYSRDLARSLFNIFLAVLLLTFALYTQSSEFPSLLWTLPLFLYCLLRHYYLVLTNATIARRFEYAITDIPLVIASALFVVVSFLIIMW